MSVDKYVKFISEQQKSMVNAGLAEATENYTHELDATDAKGMVAHLKKNGFHAKIHKAAGPAGGASVVRLGHPDGVKHVHSYIKQYYDDDHSKSDDMYKINEDLEFKSEEMVNAGLAEAHDHVTKTFTNHPDHGAVDHDVDDHEFAKDIMKRHGADVKVHRKDKNGKPVHAGGYVTHVTYSGPKASVASASREHREVAKEMRDEAN